MLMNAVLINFKRTHAQRHKGRKGTFGEEGVKRKRGRNWLGNVLAKTTRQEKN